MLCVIQIHLLQQILSVFLKVCTSQNYFNFRNKFYIQRHGLVMGSPISPLLADIFMDAFKTKIFSNNKCKEKYLLLVQICWWYLVCIWTGTSRPLHLFLKYINSINTCTYIQFTTEIGQKDKIINFLDLKIDVTSVFHKFEIYRKDTYSDNIIPINWYIVYYKYR